MAHRSTTSTPNESPSLHPPQVRCEEALSMPPQPLERYLLCLGFFGFGAAVQFTPSIVLSSTLAASGGAPSSPRHVAHTASPALASSRMAGMRGSASSGLIVRRMRSLAGTVTMAQNSSGAGWPLIS